MPAFAPQSNLLMRKRTESDDPPLIKLTTFGSQGSNGVEIPLFVSPARQVADSERSRTEKKAVEVRHRDTVILQSQPTAAFPDVHSGKRRQPEDLIENESSFTLGTDLSEREAAEKTEEDRLPPVEDSVNMRKSALLRLETLDREEYVLIHRCCRRLQKGIFAVISLYQESDWWILRLSDLGGKEKCEIVLEAGHLWQKHSPTELVSLIELDSEDHLILPSQRLDLFVPKDAEQSISSTGSERRKSATFGPKKEATRKKMMAGVEYELGLELKLRGSKTELSISAVPTTGQGGLLERCFTPAEMAEVSLSVELVDIEKVADAVLSRLQLNQGSLRLYAPITRRESVSSLIPEISGISYQTSRSLNDGQRYIITFSSIPLDSGTEKTIYVDAQPLAESKQLEKQLEIEEDELRALVHFPSGDLLSEHLETVADLLIIENGAELHLGRRQLAGKQARETPVIQVIATSPENCVEAVHVPVPMRVPVQTKAWEKAAVAIQKHWRGRLARESRVLEAARKGRKLVMRAGVLAQFAIVSGLQGKGRKLLISESLDSESRLEREIKSSDFPPFTDVFIDAEAEKTAVALVLQKIHRGTVAREQVQLAKQYSTHVPAATKVVTLGTRRYAASVYSVETGVKVEAAPLKPQHRGELLKATFSRGEIKRFGKPVDFPALLNALKVEGETLQLVSEPAELPLYHSELKLAGRKCLAIVSADRPGPEAILTFDVQSGTSKWQAKNTLKELMTCTSSNNNQEVAQLACNLLLSLRGGKLELNTAVRVPVLIGHLQAVARGYLVRRQFPLNTPKSAFASDSKSKFSHNLAFSITSGFSMSPKADLPRPASTDNQLQRGRLRVETMAPTSINSLPPSPMEASPIHSRTLKRFDSFNASDTEEPPFQIRLPHKSKERKVRRVAGKRTKSDVPSAITQRRLKGGEVLFVPVYESARTELVTKVGAEISGYHCVVAVHRTAQGASIELVLSGSKEAFHLALSDPLPSDLQEAEIAASSLISRLRLRSRQGNLTLELRPVAPQVLYKRSHYISERYMVVTVLDQGSSVELQATDPAGQRTLQLNLGRIKAISAEQLYRQICALVVRLRVEKVLGDEVLVLGS